MSLRNTLTNIMGGVIALYGAGEIAMGQMTPFKAIIGGATMLASFATGAKDDRLEALIARLSPEDKTAVHGSGSMRRDAGAGRTGYDVTPQGRNNGDNDFGAGDSDWSTWYGGATWMGADVGTEGAGLGRSHDKPYQAALDEMRRNLYPQIDGAGITGPEYVARTKAAMGRTPHIKIIADAPIATPTGATPLGQPNTHRRLKVPYLSQRDNYHYPNGSCNVTSIAMCLLYHGITGDGNGQLEDELYEAMERQGLSRHNPYHLKIIAEEYGTKDEFVSNAQIEQIKLAIDEGIPVVAHGYLTEFGHIIVIVGYNVNGFIVHDPYGEWHDWGYDLNNASSQRKGEGLTYSYGLFCRLFMHDGGAWCHFISKGD